MFERHIQLIRTDDPGQEDVSATRERLKAQFPPGAVRRMTQLGMVLGALINELSPAQDDTIVYASQYAEGRTLEAFLDSFPAASPIGFQTSIHPGAIQQSMIRRAQAVGEFLPMAGDVFLPGQSLLAAMLSPAARVMLCGGEERGTWLTEIDGASTRTYAYAMLLTTASPANATATTPAPIGRIRLEATDALATPLPPAEWFEILHKRRKFTGVIVPDWRVQLEWV